MTSRLEPIIRTSGRGWRHEPGPRGRATSDVDRGSDHPVVKHFFITLQQDLHEWISLGTTKTGMVYRQKGHAVERHD